MQCLYLSVIYLYLLPKLEFLNVGFNNIYVKISFRFKSILVIIYFPKRSGF